MATKAATKQQPLAVPPKAAAKKAAPAATPAPVSLTPQAAPAAEAKAPKVPKPPKPPAPTCSATKKNGQPCTSKVKEGLDVCVDHQPVLNRLTPEQGAGWNQWVSEQDAGSIADLLGWHKVRELIGDPVNLAPKPKTEEVAA